MGWNPELKKEKAVAFIALCFMTAEQCLPQASAHMVSCYDEAHSPTVNQSKPFPP